MTSTKMLTVYGGINSVSIQTNFAGKVLSSATGGLALGMQAYNTDPILGVIVRFGDRAGTPPSYACGIESFGANGLPDGTYLGGGSPVSKIFTPPADSSWNSISKAIAFDNPLTPTRGQELCFTFRHSSGTIDGSNNQTIFYCNGIRKVRRGFPNAVGLTAGTWAYLSAPSLVAYYTANSVYGEIATTVTVGTTASTSGHRRAGYFTRQGSGTYQIAGFETEFQGPASGGSVKFGLWDAAGTELASATLDSDLFPALSTDIQVRVLFKDSTLPTLNYGTKYYVGVECVSSASINSRLIPLEDASFIKTFPGGDDIGYASWNGSAWSETQLFYFPFQLLLADETMGGGGVQPLGGLIRAA